MTCDIRSHEFVLAKLFAHHSVVADERDEAWICISKPLSHLCSMYYVRVSVMFNADPILNALY